MNKEKIWQEKEKERIEKMKAYEYQAYEEGYKLIAGIDEVGRGAMAGPVVAAAVILPPDFFLSGVNDSKVLTEKKRISMAAEIKKEAISWVAGIVSSSFIDRENILIATKVAMSLAVKELKPCPDFLLIDAVKLYDINIRQYSIIKGDSLSISIACASIVAKVERDNIMRSFDSVYPGYGFSSHKGYVTKKHRKALLDKGPSPIHRVSFEPVKSMVIGGSNAVQLSLF